MIYRKEVCHGETKRNKEQRVLGRTDDPLSEKGLAQAAELAEKMKEIEIVDPLVTIRSTLKPSDHPMMEALADAILK